MVKRLPMPPRQTALCRTCGPVAAPGCPGRDADLRGIGACEPAIHDVRVTRRRAKALGPLMDLIRRRYLDNAPASGQADTQAGLAVDLRA